MIALVLLLDQFPRNMFRGTPQAFATDAKARGVSERAIAAGHDKPLPRELRMFIYMPFMHSEAMADQDRCLALMEELGEAEQIKYARIHRDVIERFGRFPHRNDMLGRVSTPEEMAFLEGGGFRA